MIYVIGDSHVSVFSGVDRHNNDRHIQPEFGYCYTLKKGQLRQKINKFFQELDPFCAIKVGSWTAYQLPDKIDNIQQAIKEYEIKDKDFVFLCFGEIDIRHHIGFHSDANNISFEDGIDICLERYKWVICKLKKEVKNLGIFGAIPSTVWRGTSDYPSYKDVNLRNKMTLVFNKKLKQICKDNNVIFKEINTKMLNENLEFNQSDYFIDGHHLGQKSTPIILKEFSDVTDIIKKEEQ